MASQTGSVIERGNPGHYCTSARAESRTHLPPPDPRYMIKVLTSGARGRRLGVFVPAVRPRCRQNHEEEGAFRWSPDVCLTKRKKKKQNPQNNRALL